MRKRKQRFKGLVCEGRRKHIEFKLEKAGLFRDKNRALLTVLCVANAMEKVFWKLSVRIIYVIHSLRKIMINVLSFQAIMVRLLSIKDISIPSGHILVDSSSIRLLNSSWKVRRNDIDFERQIHVEIMTSIRRNIDEFSTWIFRPCFVVSSVLVVSIVSFSNIFCSGNLF